MIGYSTLSDIFQNLFNTNLVAKIYHDVFIIMQGNSKTPAYRNGTSWMTLGLDDRKSLYCYCRQIGDAKNKKTQFVGSGKKMFNLVVPFRFVFFNANEERSFDSLTQKILNISYGKDVELIGLVTDVQQLQNSEGSIKDFELTAKAFYAALDLSITLRLTQDLCGQEIKCDGLPNPICGVKKDDNVLADGDSSLANDADTSTINV